MSYTIFHDLFDEALDVEVTRSNGFAVVRCSTTGTFDLQFPGQFKKFVRARFRVRMFFEPDPSNTANRAPRGHWETVERILAVKVTIFTPDGQPFTADHVTLADLQRFRDPRGLPHGSWSVHAEGQSEDIEEDPKELKVLDGDGQVNVALEELITSKSAPPLMTDTLDVKTRKRYTFDLYRVGTFFANARAGRPLPIGNRALRLIDPDGVQVATGSGQLSFEVSLLSLGKSRDAQGQPRLWTLDVLPSTAPDTQGVNTITATVIASARIHVSALQDRIDRLLGPNGSHLQLFAETINEVALARLRILTAETAETIDMHGLLDKVIDGVAQEPGVDKDVRAGALYTLARKSVDFPYGLSLSLSGVKISAINISIGASERIQPSIPALKLGVQVDGEATVEIGGFPLATVTIRDHQIHLEAGIALDGGGAYVARTWIEDNLVDVDLHWAAAIVAGVLTGGLLLLGAVGAAGLIEDEINDLIPPLVQEVVARSVSRAPEILAMVLGDDFTHRALRLEGNDIVFDYDAPIEPEPKPDPNYVPIVGRGAVQLGPDAWRFVPPSLGDTWAAKNLAKIDHIVVVMMENRSYDHVLGYRAALAGAVPQDGLTAALKTFLQTTNQNFILPALAGVDRIPPNAIGLRTAFPCTVGHRFADVAQQLGQTLVMNGRTINSPQGFLDNFKPANGLADGDVLGFYAAGDLPFYAYLGEQYGYSDHYFCSHPGPTLPNRMMFMTGDVSHDRTGMPIMENNRVEDDNVALSRAMTVFDLLSRLGVSWRVYESFPSVSMLRLFARYTTDVTNIVDVSRFATDIATGALPALSLVEPAMHHFPQSDDHATGHQPPVDMYRGQLFLRAVYSALRANPTVWSKTLLLITYDEHGGFYDHVVPPLAEARTRPAVASGATGTVAVAAPGGAAFEVPATVTTPYGVRVPALVVSPWVPAGRGPEIALDHCSIVKTILARFCPTRPFLSDRVHTARSFDAFLSATTPRTDVPLPPALKSLPAASAAAGPSLIVTPPISRRQLRSGDVDYHDLSGMWGRMLLGR